VDRVDEAYFRDTIRPMLDGHDVELIGEINDAEKPDFLSGAIALLVPIDWPEPFGLVMIEAMACGTPVIAFNRGSVPEIVDHGVTGLIVEDEAEAVAAIRRIPSLSRAVVRRTFERRFTAERMAEDYLALYRRLAARARPALRIVR
jgi:glycosyltransferase involved in cell wall biosynthesis